MATTSGGGMRIHSSAYMIERRPYGTSANASPSSSPQRLRPSPTPEIASASAVAGRAPLGFGSGGVLDEVGDGLAGAGAQLQERAQLCAGDAGVADQGE